MPLRNFERARHWTPRRRKRLGLLEYLVELEIFAIEPSQRGHFVQLAIPLIESALLEDLASPSTNVFVQVLTWTAADIRATSEAPMHSITQF